MMRRLSLAGGLAAAALWAVPAVPAAAQTTIGADVALNSQYVWRGLSYTNRPVIQPDVWISALGFTGGVWANVEPGSYTGADDISENGVDGAGIAEIDGWIEYARTTGNLNWKLGWTIYTFDTNNDGLTAQFDTHEFYGQASISGLPITPTLYAAYDVDKVKGLYLQPAVSRGLKVSPAMTVTLTALAGISAGQEVSASDPSANFAKSGLVHVDFGAATSFSAGSISIAPQFHVQWCRDDFTKIATPTTQHSTKIWGGVTLSWSHALGASK
jgi:hypothetical protein